MDSAVEARYTALRLRGIAVTTRLSSVIYASLSGEDDLVLSSTTDLDKSGFRLKVDGHISQGVDR